MTSREFVVVFVLVTLSFVAVKARRRLADLEVAGASRDELVRDLDGRHAMLYERFQALDRRVRFPRFDAHCKTCDSCSGKEGTKGGESPICPEGFRVLHLDLRAERER